MTKELEALETIKNITIIKDYEENGLKRIVFASEVYEKQINNIETALKALEIMKTKLGIEEEDFFYDDVLGYMFIGNVVSKEEYDLLKEVLL